jgi:hypothetical protein
LPLEILVDLLADDVALRVLVLFLLEGDTITMIYPVLNFTLISVALFSRQLSKFPGANPMIFKIYIYNASVVVGYSVFQSIF